MTDERAHYLASGDENGLAEKEHLDVIRRILEEETTWSQPPPDVTDRLLASISEEGERESAPRARLRWWTWAAAFAGVALVVVVLGSLGVFDAPAQVITMQGTDLQPAASGEASIQVTNAGWSIRLDVNGLPPAGDGQYYEGWLWSDDGDGISVGTFHLREADSVVMLWSGVDPDEYPSLWVTLEKEDGDPGASDQIVMRGKVSTP